MWRWRELTIKLLSIFVHYVPNLLSTCRPVSRFIFLVEKETSLRLFDYPELCAGTVLPSPPEIQNPPRWRVKYFMVEMGVIETPSESGTQGESTVRR